MGHRQASSPKRISSSLIRLLAEQMREAGSVWEGKGRRPANEERPSLIVALMQRTGLSRSVIQRAIHGRPRGALCARKPSRPVVEATSYSNMLAQAYGSAPKTLPVAKPAPAAASLVGVATAAKPASPAMGPAAAPQIPPDAEESAALARLDQRLATAAQQRSPIDEANMLLRDAIDFYFSLPATERSAKISALLTSLEDHLNQPS